MLKSAQTNYKQGWESIIHAEVGARVFYAEQNYFKLGIATSAKENLHLAYFRKGGRREMGRQNHLKKMANNPFILT